MIVRFSLFFGHWIKVDTIEITNANVSQNCNCLQKRNDKNLLHTHNNVIPID